MRELAPDARLLVGMSLGGLTALALTDRAPDLVRSLVLVDVTPGVNREKSTAIAQFIDGPEYFESFDEILERTVQFNPTRSETSLRRGILHNAIELPDGRWRWRYDLPRRGSGEGEEGRIMPGLDELWDAAARVKVPFLLARGSTSPVVDDEDVAELQRRNPEAEVVVIEGAGHSIQGDRPLELAELLAHASPLAFRRARTPPRLFSRDARSVARAGRARDRARALPRRRSHRARRDRGRIRHAEVR